MVWHEAIGQQPDTETVAGHDQESLKVLVICGIEEQCLTPNAAVDDVIDQAAKCYARTPRHDTQGANRVPRREP
jgi:hypothetical protein